jgi:hypothetical protein
MINIWMKATLCKRNGSQYEKGVMVSPRRFHRGQRVLHVEREPHKNLGVIPTSPETQVGTAKRKVDG